MKIFGFGLIKNGVKFDFPFKESILSMSPIVEKVFYNYGPSDDGSKEVLKSLDKVVVCEKDWDDSRTDKGLILSEMTNHALNSLRESLDPEKDKDAWAIYLQSDELFHEQELNQIQEDIKKANDSGCDAMKFRYLHFWQSHNQIAVNKKWYPHEVRAIKVFTPIESWGDAQGFKNYSKVYESNTHIYHYGHVRDEKAYKEKMDRMIRYYHPAEGLKKFAKKWHGKDKKTLTLNFFGTHPQLMKSRMDRIGGKHSLPEVEKIYIVGSISSNLQNSIKAKQIILVKSISEVPKEERTKAIIIKPSWPDKLIHPTKVPKGMYSKIARPWEDEFRIKMKLYEKEIGTR